MGESVHIPVLLNEVIDALMAKEEGMYLDCTFGGGGHSKAILEANLGNQVIACDRDLTAVERGQNKFQGNDRITILHSPYSEIYDRISTQKFKGVLMDLGMSTDQLKGDRGFSFEDKSPLDMRMDRTKGYSADDVVNRTTEHELYVVLKKGGVGSQARAVSRSIVAKRPINNTSELSRAINDVATSVKESPAVVFQAIRIEVNGEFAEIEKLLSRIPNLMLNQGRLAVISFHSLEDELVTKKMRSWASGDTAPALLGGTRGARPIGKLLTKKAITPDVTEIQENPASRSARLRVFEFINN